MSSYLVLSDLRSRLKEGMSEWLLEKKNHDRTLPSIYIGQLPPRLGSAPPGKEVTSQEDMPFILIRGIDGGLSADDSSALNQLNVAVICGIYSKESFSDYEHGVQIVMNVLDKTILTISQFQFWGNNTFSLDSEMKYGYGLGKTIDPYECGLQTEAPYFAAVLHISFNQKLHLPKLEYQRLI